MKESTLLLMAKILHEGDTKKILSFEVRTEILYFKIRQFLTSPRSVTYIYLKTWNNTALPLTIKVVWEPIKHILDSV